MQHRCPSVQEKVREGMKNQRKPTRRDTLTTKKSISHFTLTHVERGPDLPDRGNFAKAPKETTLENLVFNCSGRPADDRNVWTRSTTLNNSGSTWKRQIEKVR